MKYILDSEKIKKEFKSIRNFERKKNIPIKTLYRYIHQTNTIDESFKYFSKLEGYLIKYEIEDDC